MLEILSCFNGVLDIQCQKTDVIVFESARYGRNDSVAAVKCHTVFQVELQTIDKLFHFLPNSFLICHLSPFIVRCPFVLVTGQLRGGRAFHPQQQVRRQVIMYLACQHGNIWRPLRIWRIPTSQIHLSAAWVIYTHCWFTVRIAMYAQHMSDGC